MTPREREIMEHIKNNPMISQDELADLLSISRSSIATHIVNLTNRGYILGRGYLLRNDDYIVVVGGANYDILSFPYKKLIERDSNPGHISSSPGGVGRNIAENLGRLGAHTSLVSLVGNDNEGDKIIESLKKVNVDTNHVYKYHGQRTSKYLALHDEDGDMYYAISDMDIFEKLDPEFLENSIGMIKSSRLLIIDMNLNFKTIDYLLSLGHRTMAEAVSVNKVIKLKPILDKVDILKANSYEIGALADMEIKSKDDLKKAAHYLLKEGVGEIVATYGKIGAYYFSKDEEIFVPSKTIEVVSASGAGDAFAAGYSYGILMDMEVKERLEFASACSRIALQSEGTSSDKFNLENIRREIC